MNGKPVCRSTYLNRVETEVAVGEGNGRVEVAVREVAVGFPVPSTLPTVFPLTSVSFRFLCDRETVDRMDGETVHRVDGETV